MPKKSDRPRHGSTMSNLLPNVDLDPESDEAKPDESPNSTTEEQNDTTVEEKNYRTTEKQSNSATELQEEAPPAHSGLPIHPNERPDLKKKLGPYVADVTSEALEEVFLQMRRHYGSDVSKSLIVEAALRYLLSDALEQGTNSELAHWLDQVFSTSEESR